jgi:hypothetical protein
MLLPLVHLNEEERSKRDRKKQIVQNKKDRKKRPNKKNKENRRKKRKRKRKKLRNAALNKKKMKSVNVKCNKIRHVSDRFGQKFRPKIRKRLNRHPEQNENKAKMAEVHPPHHTQGQDHQTILARVDQTHRHQH